MGASSSGHAPHGFPQLTFVTMSGLEPLMSFCSTQSWLRSNRQPLPQLRQTSGDMSGEEALGYTAPERPDHQFQPAMGKGMLEVIP